ncbi:MAG: glycosyl-4,4'-diaponeurosporenoate acyltransferase [Clostridia bacterium]|nr:glycosyl-4,4'-diaponeurosporenoate acyltransferase [Clostridia bacterium]
MEFIKCLIYLGCMGFLFFLVGRTLPRRWFQEDCFPYKSYKFEKDGKIYIKTGVRKWKNKLPDMSRIFPSIIPAKRINGDFSGKASLLVEETRIAEQIHYLLILAGFLCIKIWKGFGGIVVSVLFAIGNIPFIMIQRYNRPKLIRIMEKKNLTPCDIMKGTEYENQTTCC